ELLARSDLSFARLAAIWPELGRIPPRIAAQLEIDARYSTYVDRQAADIEAFRKDEAVRIPPGLDYAAVSGLSTEVRQKLETLRPATLAQASRMEGITPAAVMLVLAHLRRAGVRPVASTANRGGCDQLILDTVQRRSTPRRPTLDADR